MFFNGNYLENGPTIVLVLLLVIVILIGWYSINHKNDYEHEHEHEHEREYARFPLFLLSRRSRGGPLIRDLV